VRSPHKPAHDEGVGIATVIWSNQDSVSGIQRLCQPIKVTDFVIHHALDFAQMTGEQLKLGDQLRPPRAAMWRHKLIRPLNDDFLHYYW
jgi:hypothetical protein